MCVEDIIASIFYNNVKVCHFCILLLDLEVTIPVSQTNKCDLLNCSNSA